MLNCTCVSNEFLIIYSRWQISLILFAICVIEITW